MNTKISLNSELLKNLPVLKVFNKFDEENFYSTQSVEFGEITLVNTKNSMDDWVIPFKDFKKISMDTIGIIKNFKDYRYELNEALLEQEVDDYQTSKRISNYNW